jgi:hypothetical protein
MPSVGVLHVLDSTSNKPRPLTLASNVLSVNDSNARSSLASLDGKMTTNNSSLTTINSTLGGTLTVSDSTAQASLSSINSALGSTLTVSDGTAQSTLSAIDSKLGGTIATSTSLAVTKGDTTVSNAASVVNGDLSSSHDARSNRKLGIFGTTTDTSNNIEIHVSQDNSTYYKYGHTDIFPASDGSFSAFLEAPFKYVKLKYLGNATVTAIIAGVD